MGVHPKRTRIISIRLSCSEHAQLLSKCEEHGARSVSDLARHAMLSLNQQETKGEALEGVRQRLGRLDRRIDLLHEEVLRLSAIVNRRS